MIYGNQISSGKKGGGGLNIFCQTTQPDAYNGIWIKNDNVDKVIMKSDYYLADGESQKTNYNPDVIGCIGEQNVKDGIAYISDYGNQRIRKYDIKNNVINTGTSLNVRGSSPTLVGNFIIYTAQGSTSIYKYDVTTETYTTFASPAPTTLTYWNHICCDNKYCYIEYIQSSGSPKAYRLIKVDPDTDATTTINNRNFEGSQTPVYSFMYYYSGLIYDFMQDKLYMATDVATGTRTIKNKTLYISKGSLDGAFSQSYSSQCKLLNLIYVIGTGRMNSSSNRRMLIVDLSTETCTEKEDAMPSDFIWNNEKAFGTFLYEGTIYTIGRIDYRAAELNNIYKYAINTHNFDNNTAILNLTSLGNNTTKMIEDDKNYIVFGADEAYYQSSSGFTRQSAAIIKNGVIINI